jgi:predicted nuclease with TOPRIM domain
MPESSSELNFKERLDVVQAENKALKEEIDRLKNQNPKLQNHIEILESGNNSDDKSSLRYKVVSRYVILKTISGISM